MAGPRGGTERASRRRRKAPMPRRLAQDGIMGSMKERLPGPREERIALIRIHIHIYTHTYSERAGQTNGGQARRH